MIQNISAILWALSGIILICFIIYGYFSMLIDFIRWRKWGAVVAMITLVIFIGSGLLLGL